MSEDTAETPSTEIPGTEQWSDSSQNRTVFISEKRDFKYLRSGIIVVTEGPDKGRKVDIDRQRVSIGRSSGCDLILDDPSVSYQHAEIVVDESGHLLRDTHSTNGIFMMGHRIRSVFLRPGSSFQVGNNLLVFEPSQDVVSVPLSLRDRFGHALGHSIKMREMFAVLERSATSDLPILIHGETGTGKDLLASAIHSYSLRKNRPLVVMDCGAVPPNLIEDVLFGHEKGAFTGAEGARDGMFQQADGGTLLLDEVGELRLDLQPKLLRVLESGEVQKIGSIRTTPIDVRIISATHRDLWSLVDDGLFRQDLLFRLSVVEIEVPPLRERADDIPMLVKNFLEKHNERRASVGKPPIEIEEDAMAFLQAHPWPGNVRELKNVVERTAHMLEGDMIHRRDILLDMYGSKTRTTLPIDTSIPYKDAKARIVEQFERQYLIHLIQEENGNLSAASRKADIARHHLRTLCKKYAIPTGKKTTS